MIRTMLFVFAEKGVTGMIGALFGSVLAAIIFLLALAWNWSITLICLAVSVIVGIMGAIVGYKRMHK